MRPTKIVLSFILGALLLAGLFLFSKKSTVPVDGANEPKPRLLNFSQSNQPPEAKSDVATTSTPASATQIENVEPAQVEKLSASDKSKWSTFENILKTKNDNDPRMDQELKNLSLEFRKALYEKYALLPPEDHNGRGLIVYLIGRQIQTAEDLDFIKKVYQEPPCLSLADCKTAGPDDPHHSSTNQTTLVYPQLSGIYLMDKQLTENPELLNQVEFRNGFIQALIAAESYSVPAVRDRAHEIRTKWKL